MKICFVTVSTTAIRGLLRAKEEINRKFPGVLDLCIFYAAHLLGPEKHSEMIEAVKTSDAVLVDLMGSPADLISDVYRALDECRGQIIPYGQTARSYLRLGALTVPREPDATQLPMNMEAMRRMGKTFKGMSKMAKIMPPGKMRDMHNLAQVMKYFALADAAQMENLLYLMLREYGGYRKLPKPPPAREIVGCGICDPATRKYYRSYKDYAAEHGFDPDKPTVAVFFSGRTYPTDTAECVAGVIGRLAANANILPVAFAGTSAENFPQLREWLITTRKVDAIINFMPFRLGAGPLGGKAEEALDLLKEVNAPYIHPFFMTRRHVSEWQQSAQGVTSNEFLISVMLPELDGATEPIPVGAMSELKDEDAKADLRELVLIDERVQRLSRRITNLIRLRRLPNSRKKIAIICYNYPPGEGNIFGGAFLDTFASVADILKALQAAGYTTEPLSADDLMAKFTAGRIVNSGKYAADETVMIRYPPQRYREYLAEIPEKDEIIRQWGEPPGSVMVSAHGEFLVPGIVSGNVFIGLQPSRGVHEDPQKAYHDRVLPPHHQYLAFYLWLREEFRADAVIHVGTHGTLEFLKGKECGLSGDCFPDRLIADMPHIYLYYVGNPSEAMIAKRRAYANIISYQPPPFVQGDLYGEYAELSAMIGEYREALRVSPERSADILTGIRQRATRAGLPQELEDLERELYRMKRSLIPAGLHVFGRGYAEHETRSYATNVLRYDRGEIKSLQRIIAEAEGLDYDRILKDNDTGKMAALDRRAETVLTAYCQNGLVPDVLSHRDALTTTLEYGRKVMAGCRQNAEMGNLLRVLSGHYNPARLGGDIIRNPEVLPTGYNIYQFDPRFVPSQTACERGWKIAEATIERYRKDNHGETPSTTAVILWGLETSRTQGETVAQILAYLGVRVLRGGNMWEPRYEIIPLQELGRPRIDVVIHICGFFRDMFPNIIEGLNNLFQRLASLDEPDEMNRFKANTKKIYRVLRERGYAEEEAQELARSRIFGPGEGEYGTGITQIIETKNWEREEQIGEEFVRKLRYIYSKNYRGRDVSGLLDDNLRSVEIVSQIRSNPEYEITDLDHYYEFFGGLAKSVEMARGSKPSMYITDTTEECIVAEGVDRAIGRGIRTRVLNPKWIDSMLEHKYHGVQKIAERFANIMGLAATTNSVAPWVYDELFRKYVDDETMRRRLKENNPHAYLNILEQMVEYRQRGYWQATAAQMEKLKEAILELEGDIEGDI